MSALGRAIALVWRAAPRYFLGSVALELVMAGALMATLFLGREIVAALTGPEPSSLASLLPAVVGLGAALTVSGVSQVAVRELRGLIAEETVRATQEQIVEVATSVTYDRFESASFHDLLQRANTQVVQASYAIVSDLLGLVNVVATSAAVVTVLVATVPQVLGALVAVAVPFALAARFSAQLGFKVRYALTTDDRLRNYLYRAQTGERTAKELRVFALADPLRERWSSIFDERLSRLRRLSLKRVVYNGLAALAAALLVAGVLLVLVDAAIDGRIGFADTAVAIVALQQLAVRIRTAANATGSLRGSALFLDDFEEYRAMAETPPLQLAPAPLPPGKLELVDVAFKYPGTDRLVLEDVSLAIEPGEIVALVGASGSGKTTLAHLIAGLYRPTQGHVRYGGVDLDEIDPDAYRRTLGFVFQDFERYEMSAGDNIAISDTMHSADSRRVAEAAERAGIREAIEASPGGYDSFLSRKYEGGVELSVGQWQRVAIARAFFRDAPLLVLDEPSAALDPIAEADLLERLRSLVTDRSVLMISHRFSTMRLADRILVMADGRLVEEGSHSELMALGGRYAELFTVQAKGYLPDPPQGE